MVLLVMVVDVVVMVRAFLVKTVRNSIISLERLVHIPSSKFSDDTDGGDEMLEE